MSFENPPSKQIISLVPQVCAQICHRGTSRESVCGGAVFNNDMCEWHDFIVENRENPPKPRPPPHCPRISHRGTRREHICGKEKYKNGVCYYHWKKSPAGNRVKAEKNFCQ